MSDPLQSPAAESEAVPAPKSAPHWKSLAASAGCTGRKGKDDSRRLSDDAERV